MATATVANPPPNDTKLVLEQLSNREHGLRERLELWKFQKEKLQTKHKVLNGKSISQGSSPVAPHPSISSTHGSPVVFTNAEARRSFPSNGGIEGKDIHDQENIQFCEMNLRTGNSQTAISLTSSTSPLAVSRPRHDACRISSPSDSCSPVYSPRPVYSPLSTAQLLAAPKRKQPLGDSNNDNNNSCQLCQQPLVVRKPWSRTPGSSICISGDKCSHLRSSLEYKRMWEQASTELSELKQKHIKTLERLTKTEATSAHELKEMRALYQKQLKAMARNMTLETKKHLKEKESQFKAQLVADRHTSQRDAQQMIDMMRSTFEANLMQSRQMIKSLGEQLSVYKAEVRNSLPLDEEIRPASGNPVCDSQKIPAIPRSNSFDYSDSDSGSE